MCAGNGGDAGVAAGRRGAAAARAVARERAGGGGAAGARAARRGQRVRLPATLALSSLTFILYRPYQFN